MTLRTATTTLDPLTLAEWRNTIATWLGISYANIDTSAQTELNRMIDEAHEYISQRFGHEPWTMREKSLSLASGTGTLSMDADVRHVILITETYSGSTREAILTTKADYLAAWGEGFDTHPWNGQTEARWFFDGMTSDNPPQQQWRRVPTPDGAVTGTALVRPYFTLLGTTGDTQYTELPPHAVSALREHLRALWALFERNYEAYGIHRQAREEQLAAMAQSDNPAGAVEQPIEITTPSVFRKEMNLGAG